MKYLPANRIFMFFPGKLWLNCIVALWVAWQHQGACWEVMGLNKWCPLWRHALLPHSQLLSRHSSLWLAGEGVFFPSQPFPILSSQQCSGLLFCSFVFECPHLYWARKLFNFVPGNLIMISRHDFIKAAMGLCSKPFNSNIGCLIIALGPSKQASGYAVLIYF